MTMTKFVFFVTIAVLVAVLYSIPSHAGDKGNGNGASHGANATPAGTPSPNEKAMQNSNGQFQSDRKFGQERAAVRKNEKAKQAVQPAPESKTTAQ